MAHITITDEGTISLADNWTLKESPYIVSTLDTVHIPEQKKIVVDGSQIKLLDSSGAMVICHLLERLRQLNKEIQIEHFDPKHNNLLEFTESHEKKIEKGVVEVVKRNFLYRVGLITMTVLDQGIHYVNFIGEVSTHFWSILQLKKRWKYRNTLHSIEEVGYNAIPIISLLMFLVGIVLSYQLGMQLESYGANIFIVNLTGLAVLREFGPLIAAVIVAGRTSSSYTAEIGLMQINEEIDALSVMGMSPMNRVAIPKIISVVICMPLLTVVADTFGVFGSMVMSEVRFGINLPDFISRFEDVTSLPTLWTGLSKAPVFGAIIGSVGCFQGFRVKKTADSLGRQTTKSVVLSIFLVIVADAIFSVLFSMAGI